MCSRARWSYELQRHPFYRWENWTGERLRYSQVTQIAKLGFRLSEWPRVRVISLCCILTIQSLLEPQKMYVLEHTTWSSSPTSLLASRCKIKLSSEKSYKAQLSDVLKENPHPQPPSNTVCALFRSMALTPHEVLHHSDFRSTICSCVLALLECEGCP